jgi:hypothetical protein
MDLDRLSTMDRPNRSLTAAATIDDLNKFGASADFRRVRRRTHPTVCVGYRVARSCLAALENAIETGTQGGPALG